MPAQPDISMPPMAGTNDAALRAEIARLTAALSTVAILAANHTGEFDTDAWVLMRKINICANAAIKRCDHRTGTTPMTDQPDSREVESPEYQMRDLISDAFACDMDDTRLDWLMPKLETILLAALADARGEALGMRQLIHDVRLEATETIPRDGKDAAFAALFNIGKEINEWADQHPLPAIERTIAQEA